MRRGFAAMLAATAIAACSSAGEPGSPAAETWVGTVTREGDVTTVVNESGTVWGGPATLTEEASIGVDVGDDPYMFGRVTSVWATDEAIYVVDMDVPAVRVYDRGGRYLRDLGRPGQGPGEYNAPFRVAVRPDGAVFVSQRPTSLIVYSKDGEYLDTWSWTARVFSATQQLVVGDDGTPFLESYDLMGDEPRERETRWGMQAVGPDGKLGELREFIRPDVGAQTTLTYMDGGLITELPFAAFFRASMLPSGELVYGVGEPYRFTMEAPDGARTIVDRRYQPVALQPDERSAHERFLTARIRSRDPGWAWSGPPVPDHKPAFEAFHPARDGRLLVSRKGPGVRIEGADCHDDPTPDDFASAPQQAEALTPCWHDPLIWDVFGADGRYLGELPIPDVTVVAEPFLDGDTLLIAIEDEAGTIVVKRYRVAPPGR